MTPISSSLYIGKVWHRRWRPKRHDLEYRVYSMLVDLDELPNLEKELRFFSHNRFNVFSIHDRDFGPGDGSPLRPWVEAQLRTAQLQWRDLHISLLCYPRLLGYAFNPLSVYFCSARGGDLIAILYEVHNTFGERHCYLLPVDGRERVIEQRCAKAFYVSPFIGMDAIYDFQILPPNQSATVNEPLMVSVHERDAEGLLLEAAFRAKRMPLSDRALVSLLGTHPLMTLKVIAGIHWEALMLWLKGIKIVPKPKPPSLMVTIAPRKTENVHDHLKRRVGS